MNDSLQILSSNSKAEGENSLNPQQLSLITLIVSETVCSLLSDKKALSRFIHSNQINKSIPEAAEEYLTYMKDADYSKKYCVSIKATLQKFKIYTQINHINTPCSVTTKNMEEFLNWRKKSAPKGFKIDYRNLKAFYSKLCIWGYVSENPCVNVRLPREQKEETVYLTREDLETILNYASPAITRKIFLFTFLTGLRLSEVTNLRWTNVNFSEGFITVGDKSFVTKSRKVRRIPLTSEALEILKGNSKILGIDGFVFCKSNGKKYSDDFVSKSFKRALRKTNLNETICFHTLRHSGISYMLNNGVPPNIVKEIAGHSSLSVTNIYSHANFEELRNAVKALDQRKDSNIAEGNNG